jgi:hypothetical protein
MYWKEGQFKVCFRPKGVFYCEEYGAKDATWKIVNEEVIIDWGEYGKYALSKDEGKNMKGHGLPFKEGDETNWRKTLYFGALTPVDKFMMGDGFGTEWNFKYKGGEFPVQFMCDGKNTFGNPYSTDATWTLTTKNDKTGKVKINWGEHGEYLLEVEVKDKSMETPAFEEGEDGFREASLKSSLTEFKYDAPKKDDHGHGEDDPGHGAGDDHGHGGHGHGHGHAHGGGSGHAHGGGSGHSHGGGHGHSHGEGHGHGHGHGHGSGHGHAEGDGIVGLGNLTLAGEKFMIDREGQVTKDKETEFGVERVGPGKASGFKAWLEDSKGEKLCDPVEGDGHDDHWHFHCKPSADAASFVLSCGDEVSKISVQPGAAPASDGILNVLEDADGKLVGFIELKLHDDAGDLELFICKDGAMKEPLDFPPTTSITVTFPTHGNKSVTLAVRNEDQNEDEDGNPTMRDGKTNYFIFPGESGQDPSWLTGEKFRSTTTVKFTVDDKTYIAPPFILVPHSHDE